MVDSFYQKLKPVINELLGLSNDAIHMHIGVAVFVITILITKKKLNHWNLLIPVFIISIMLECLDLFDDWRFEGTFHIARSLHDIINTNLIPLVLVWLARKKKIQTEI